MITLTNIISSIIVISFVLILCYVSYKHDLKRLSRSEIKPPEKAQSIYHINICGYFGTGYYYSRSYDVFKILVKFDDELYSYKMLIDINTNTFYVKLYNYFYNPLLFSKEFKLFDDVFEIENPKPKDVYELFKNAKKFFIDSENQRFFTNDIYRKIENYILVHNLDVELLGQIKFISEENK